MPVEPGLMTKTSLNAAKRAFSSFVLATALSGSPAPNSLFGASAAPATNEIKGTITSSALPEGD